MAHMHVSGPNHAKNNRKATRITLLIASILIFTFMLLEFFGGLVSGSMALVSDAAHMLSDLISLLMGLAAVIIAGFSNNNKRTYGYTRFEIIISFANALLLIFISIMIIYEAILRFIHPVVINIKILLPIAFSGLVINIIVFLMIYLLTRNSGHDHNHSHGGHNHGINNSLSHSNHDHVSHPHEHSSPANKVSSLLLGGMILHVLSDLLGSGAAIASGIIIYYTSWYYIDPILSIFISILLLNSSYRIVRESANILMESSPGNVNIDDIAEDISSNVPNVINAHHIHLWMLNESENIITLHIVLKDYSQSYKIVEDVKNFLKNKYNILHSTIQVELEEGHCLDNEH